MKPRSRFLILPALAGLVLVTSSFFVKVSTPLAQAPLATPSGVLHFRPYSAGGTAGIWLLSRSGKSITPADTALTLSAEEGGKHVELQLKHAALAHSPSGLIAVFGATPHSEVIIAWQAPAANADLILQVQTFNETVSRALARMISFILLLGGALVLICSAFLTIYGLRHKPSMRDAAHALHQN